MESEGAVVGSMVISRDIGAQRYTEAALAESEQQ
jgi:hypothetical protein